MLSSAHEKILGVLSPHEYKYGSDVAREAKVGGERKVYVHLSQLKDWGYVESKTFPGEQSYKPIRKFKLTMDGVKRRSEIKNQIQSFITDNPVLEPS